MKIKQFNKTWLSVIFITALSMMMISSESDPDMNDGSLYVLNLDDESTYEMSCYDELTGGNWVVKNQTCTLTTSVINLPGEPGEDPELDIPINFSAHRTGNLEAEDNIVMEYKTGAEWIVVTTIPGNELSEGESEYGFRADNIPAGSSIQFRFIVKTDNSSEKITMKFRSDDHTVFVGTPFLAGTNDYFRPSELPVTLKDFYASAEDKQVTLVWSTMAEINNKQFEVERSTNGYDFTTVTIVAGAGNTNSQKNYTATDFSPPSGTSYYRLKQVDYDGTPAYSNLVSVNVEIAATGCKLKTVPNPCIGRCSFVLENCDEKNGQSVTFYVFDALGNIVYQSADMVEPGSSTFAFDSQNGLSPGVYIVRGTAGDEKLEDKFILSN